MTLNKIGEDSRYDAVRKYNVNSIVYEIGRYVVNKIEYVYGNGESFNQYYVSKNAYANEKGSQYLPQIYFEDDLLIERKPRFTVQTTSYGDLGIEEIQKVCDGYKEAIEVVEVLTKEFLK